MNITTIGIDLAKSVFQVHAADAKGKKLFSKKMNRNQLLEFMVTLSPCVLGMEACGGAHYWAREFVKLGHEVRLMSPQYVKPYIKTNKSDKNDAEGICEAVTRPHMRFVPIKTLAQQDMKLLHTIRSRLVGNKTALSNQVRGLLAEYGIVFKKGYSALEQNLECIITEGDVRLSEESIGLMSVLYEEYQHVCAEIKKYEQHIDKAAEESKEAQQLKSIPGIGNLSATALLAHVGRAEVFKRGRDLSSFLGLVPRQSGSGGKVQLHGISKRGDRYIRSLLVHGARSVVISLKRKPEKVNESKYYQWIQALLLRLPFNKVVVAVANKNARVVWALLCNNEMYIG